MNDPGMWIGGLILAAFVVWMLKKSDGEEE